MAMRLGRLPGNEASVLRMRFHEGLSQSEIAERTGVPLGTVKTHMVRGLRRLRAMVDGRGPLVSRDADIAGYLLGELGAGGASGRRAPHA